MIQCTECSLQLLRRDLIDHECLDALKQAIKDGIKARINQEAHVAEMEGRLEKQYDQFIELVRSITRSNKFV